MYPRPHGGRKPQAGAGCCKLWRRIGKVGQRHHGARASIEHERGYGGRFGFAPKSGFPT